MEIKKLNDLSSQQKKIANSYIQQISILNNWNTPKLIKRLEKSEDLNHGVYLFMEDQKIIGFFTISDADGDNIDSNNFKKFQIETNAYWITSMYITSYINKINNNAFIHVLKYLKNLLGNSNVYVYLENKKIANIINKRYNATFVSKNPLIMKITKK